MSAKAASIDAARVKLLLGQLRLPAIALAWPDLAATADREGWPAARFLAALAEVEIAERDRRRFERHLAEARLPSGKTLDNCDFAAVPMISKPGCGLAEGDSWLGHDQSCTSGRRKRKEPQRGGPRTRPRRKGWRAHARTTSRAKAASSAAKPHLRSASPTRQIPSAHPHDITYVTKDQAESSVLFELISARYERRSLLITANQPFSEWGKIFPGEAMTLAAVDRLVHHSIIFELNVESYRRKTALSRKTNAANPFQPPTSDASS